jgi:hypothetical protein
VDAVTYRVAVAVWVAVLAAAVVYQLIATAARL